MPVVSFVPTKARLVLEQSRDTVLVMRVVVARGENVLLPDGGQLQQLTGVARIRQQKSAVPSALTEGSLIYVGGPSSTDDASPPKFQINVVLPHEKFAALLEVALSGRLPANFFLEVPAHARSGDGPGITYTPQAGGRIKLWDTVKYRALPVAGFTLILPIMLPGEVLAEKANEDRRTPATTAQVSELAEAIDSFHAETRHSLIFVLTLSAVTAFIIIAFIGFGLK